MRLIKLSETQESSQPGNENKFAARAALQTGLAAAHPAGSAGLSSAPGLFGGLVIMLRRVRCPHLHYTRVYLHDAVIHEQALHHRRVRLGPLPELVQREHVILILPWWLAAEHA